MSGHSLFAPSAAERWITCPGSIALHVGGGSSTFADDGTASHTWAAECLYRGCDAEQLLGMDLDLNGATYTMDEDRVGFVQAYLDEVRREAMGGYLLVEQRVDLSEWLGPDQGGTADAIILQPDDGLVVIADLKYGTGEKVYASYPAPTEDDPKARRANKQLGLYALGALKAGRLLDEVLCVRLKIIQPRLFHIDEYDCTIAELMALAHDARIATEDAGLAMTLGADDPEIDQYLHASEKACRWCSAKATCRVLAAKVTEEVRMSFEEIPAGAPLVPQAAPELTEAMNAVPLIELWCRAVRFEVDRRVREGIQVIGSDGLPYKIVEGKQGSNKWIDAEQAEAALIGVLPPEKAYKPQEIITAPAAKKILGKKATKAMWTDVFEPMVTRAPGKPMLALGSDPRPPYSGAADADEFGEILEE